MARDLIGKTGAGGNGQRLIGRVKKNFIPWPRVLSTLVLPRRASTIRFTRYSQGQV